MMMTFPVGRPPRSKFLRRIQPSLIRRPVLATIELMELQSNTRRLWWPVCPQCACRQTMDIDPTERGEMFCCLECGHTWRAAEPPSLQPGGDIGWPDSPQ